MKIAARFLRPQASLPTPVPVESPAKRSQPERGPQTIDADLLKLVAGGLPRGGWNTVTEAQVDSTPRGSW